MEKNTIENCRKRKPLCHDSRNDSNSLKDWNYLHNKHREENGLRIFFLNQTVSILLKSKNKKINF